MIVCDRSLIAHQLVRAARRNGRKLEGAPYWTGIRPLLCHQILKPVFIIASLDSFVLDAFVLLESPRAKKFRCNRNIVIFG